jgi:hypothetical protein
MHEYVIHPKAVLKKSRPPPPQSSASTAGQLHADSFHRVERTGGKSPVRVTEAPVGALPNKSTKSQAVTSVWLQQMQQLEGRKPAF